MLPQGCLPLALFFIFLFFLPLFLAEVMLSALTRLGLSPEISVIAAFGIFLGGMINIPIYKIPQDHFLDHSSATFFGMNRILRKSPKKQNYTIVAINFGGCIVPCILAGYQIIRILSHSPYALIVVCGAIAVNVYVCYRIAQPVPEVGIALPAFIPPLVAALAAIVFIPDFAPPIAFCAGVLGPLIGADLLHMQDIKKIETGVASIGGAGTFDGIVISGLLATLLV